MIEFELHCFCCKENLELDYDKEWFEARTLHFIQTRFPLIIMSTVPFFFNQYYHVMLQKSGNFANWKRSIVYSSNYPLNKLIGVYKNHQSYLCKEFYITGNLIK